MDERTLKLQLTGPDEAQRYRAAQMLAEQASIEGLMAAVKDDSWRVRRVAVEGLAQHPDSAGVIAALLNTLRTDHQDLGTLNSVIMVMTAEDVDVITPLVDLLQGNDTNLRIYAALILGHQHDLRVVPHLLQALDDPDANVRFHVIEALGRLQAAESGNKLGEVLVSGDFFLIFPALEALALIGMPDVVPQILPLLKDRFVCAAAVTTLGQIGQIGSDWGCNGRSRPGGTAA